VVERTGQIAHVFNGNSVDEALGLNDVLPAHDLEQVTDDGLERLRRQVDQVGALIQAREDLFLARTIADTLEAMGPRYPDAEPGLERMVVPD
jgi:hypothetical protein